MNEVDILTAIAHQMREHSQWWIKYIVPRRWRENTQLFGIDIGTADGGWMVLYLDQEVDHLIVSDVDFQWRKKIDMKDDRLIVLAVAAVCDMLSAAGKGRIIE